MPTGLTCPLPDVQVTEDGLSSKRCGADLHIAWTSVRGLYDADLDTGAVVDEAWVQTWSVDCENGHTVMTSPPGEDHTTLDHAHAVALDGILHKLEGAFTA